MEFFNVCVPIMFPMMFPKFSMRSSRVFPIAPHFIPFPLPKIVPLPFFGGSLPSFNILGNKWRIGMEH
jgi:hypothetical protein